MRVSLLLWRGVSFPRVHDNNNIALSIPVPVLGRPGQGSGAAATEAPTLEVSTSTAKPAKPAKPALGDKPVFLSVRLPVRP